MDCEKAVMLLFGIPEKLIEEIKTNHTYEYEQYLKVNGLEYLIQKSEEDENDTCNNFK